MQSKVEYDEDIQKYNEEIQDYEEIKNIVQNDYVASSEEIEGQLLKINRIVGIEGYLSKEDIEFYEEYAIALKKSKKNLDDIYYSTVNSISKKIEIRTEEIQEMKNMNKYNNSFEEKYEEQID